MASSSFAFDSNVLCITALIVLCCSSYWNSLSGDLVHDDIFAIKNNVDVRPETPLSNLLADDFWGKDMSDPTSHKSYRPITTLSFRLNYLIHDLDPWGYHAVNVFLHTLCTILFWWLCRIFVFRSGIVGNDSNTLSIQAAIIFAVHPIHTEAVAGVVGRADILACIFFQCSLLCYYKCTYSMPRKSVLYLAISVLMGTFAMLCKEHGITVFGVCFLYELYLLYSQAKLKRCLQQFQDFIPMLCRMSMLCVATLSLVVFRIVTLHGHLPHFSFEDNPASFADSLLTRGLTYTYLYYFNAKLLVAPITLSYDWQMCSIPLVETLGDIRNFGTVVFLIVFSLLCWIVFANFPKRDRYLTFCGLSLLVVPFLPASNIFLRVGFVVAERILYTSSMGYCILVVHGLRQVLKAVHNRPTLCRVTSFCYLLLVASFFGKTIVRNRVWQTRESLFRSGVEILDHNPKAHYNYANYLKDVGKKDEAIMHYKSAVSLASYHASSHNNLGTLLNGSEAEHHFMEAIKNNPHHSRAYYNLGNNLRDQGRYQEAETALRNSLRIAPEYTDAIMSLANVLSLQGNYEKLEALELLKKAVKLKPSDSDILNNLASLLSTLGYLNESIFVYNQALEISPEHSIALAGLARVRRKLGDNDQAEKLFQRSLSIKADASTYHALGALYFNSGRTQDAHIMFDRAVYMEPMRADFICSYSQSISKLGDIKKAIRVLSQAVDSSAPCIHLNLASNYAKQGFFEQGLKHSNLAIKYSVGRDLAESYQLRGSVLKDMDRLTEAAESFKKAIEMSPEMMSSLMNLGAINHLMGNYDSAEHYYMAALKLDPNNIILKQNMQKLSRLRTTNPISKANSV